VRHDLGLGDLLRVTDVGVTEFQGPSPAMICAV